MAQFLPSSYSWQQLLDLARRQGALSIQVSPSDALLICQMVASTIYTKHPWQFTLETTQLGQIPCQNAVQDYAMPQDCYRLTKAWLYSNAYANGVYGSNVPVPGDPAYAAYLAALESQAFVGTNLAGTYPPQTYDLDVVKNLSVDLNLRGWGAIYAIAQLGNSGTWRLSNATYVPLNFPFEVQAEYQPFLPKFTDLGAQPFFPDQYLSMGMAGLLYYLYEFNKDPRAGTTTFQGGRTVYTGQLGAWHALMESAAMEERAGSVDTFTPTDGLGVDNGSYGGNWRW